MRPTITQIQDQCREREREASPPSLTPSSVKVVVCKHFLVLSLPPQSTYKKERKKSYSPMAKSRNPRKPVKEKHHHHSQKLQQEKDKDKPHSWAAVRSLFTCKYLHVQPQQHHVQQQQQEEEIQKQKKPEEKQKQKLKQQTKQEEIKNITTAGNQKCKKQMKNGKNEQTLDESNKKCKKMKCSGSLCSNTKVMHKPEIASSEEHIKKRVFFSMGESSDASSSSRSMKAGTTLSDLNNACAVVSNSSSSSSSSFPLPSASPSISGSFRNMPFRKLSGCYECRMVVDPVLGMTRDPSLRTTICSCAVCGEIFMKPENLELHQAVRHAGNSFF